jgi:glycosyltransferase involved in cell wall biosynthesis
MNPESASDRAPEREPPPRLTSVASALRVAFVGTYPPRQCGIATFTRDLQQAVAGAGPSVVPMILALTDSGGRYDYPRNVRYEIRQSTKSDYARAAEFVNYSDVRFVSVQHEHGIFGGDDGSYILEFLSALRVPAIATLHTVLKTPSQGQRETVQQIARQCSALVVMSQVAADLLATSYGISGREVHIIPHGIPHVEPADAADLKAHFGIAGRKMLLTFGLLGPNKGIETVIRALPALVAAFPDLVYFVVGATHPVIKRRHGEAYRTTLEREAERLGVREHLVFRDHFVTTAELMSYLQAADIFVSPYQNEAQVTSGALSYAMGAGTAAVSTPYWHAQELLADGRGRLFPFGDSVALARVLTALWRAPAELEGLRSAAYAFTRSMEWPRVGQAYLALGQAVMAEAPARLASRQRPAASSLPDLRLDHLRRLTDDTGIIQHATFNIPSRASGYCVDDNARALIVALGAERLSSSEETMRLVTTYLSYLQFSQTKDGGFQNFMRYDRTFEPSATSDDCLGRALWALGTATHLGPDDGHRLLAREMFQRALPRARELGPRGAATTILGLVSFLRSAPDAADERAALVDLADGLVTRYRDTASDDWRWFEPGLTYDNALIPLALFKAYLITRDRSSLRVARASLEFLEEVCFREQQLVLVGNDGWHKRGGSRAVSDEQSIDAAAFVLAFRGAYAATGDRHYLQRMRQSFAWFLGTNRLGVPLYDFVTAGCRDGLGASEANQNQGAESTLSFLSALLQMLELGGEGLDQASIAPPAGN